MEGGCYASVLGDGGSRSVSVDPATEKERQATNDFLQDDAGDGANDGGQGDASGTRPNHPTAVERPRSTTLCRWRRRRLRQGRYFCLFLFDPLLESVCNSIRIQISQVTVTTSRTEKQRRCTHNCPEIL